MLSALPPVETQISQMPSPSNPSNARGQMPGLCWLCHAVAHLSFALQRQRI